LLGKKTAKVRSSSGKLKTYIKKILSKLEKGDAKAKEAFIYYFEK
jgi:ribosomal protein S20